VHAATSVEPSLGEPLGLGELRGPRADRKPPTAFSLPLEGARMVHGLSQETDGLGPIIGRVMDESTATFAL